MEEPNWTNMNMEMYDNYLDQQLNQQESLLIPGHPPNTQPVGNNGLE